MKAFVSATVKWCTLVFGLAPGLAWSYTLSLAGPSEAAPGTVATYVLSIDDGTDLQTFQLDIGYDSSALQYQDFRGGSLCGTLDLCMGNDNGTFVTVSDSFLDPLATGGPLAELDFLVQSVPGPTSLTVDNVELGRSDFTTVPEDQITGQGALTTVVPLPPAWLFALSGMTALGWLHRRTRPQAG